MIKRSIAFMSLALALSTMCQAQSRKIINLSIVGFLPRWQSVVSGSRASRLGYRGSFR